MSELNIEVSYARPEQQWLIAVKLPVGACVQDAIKAALASLPALPDLTGNLGIFAQAARLDTVLQDGDRVEIYRPLQVDPKLQRRERAVREPYKKTKSPR
jgi:uncharacterized protein